MIRLNLLKTSVKRVFPNKSFHNINAARGLHYGEFDPIKPAGSDSKSSDEDSATKTRRLLWQSRKRGISENDLLLSTWFERNHKNMSEEDMDEYDRLINAQVNEWDLFHWISKAKPTPVEFDNETMWALQKHCANEKKETRFKQPVLKYKPQAQ